MKSWPLLARAMIAELACLLAAAMVVVLRYIGGFDETVPVFTIYIIVSVIFIVLFVLNKLYGLAGYLILATCLVWFLYAYVFHSVPLGRF